MHSVPQSDHARRESALAGTGLRRVALLCLQDGSLKYAIQKTSRGKERRNVTPFYVIVGPGPR